MKKKTKEIAITIEDLEETMDDVFDSLEKNPELVYAIIQDGKHTVNLISFAKFEEYTKLLKNLKPVKEKNLLKSVQSVDVKQQ